MIRIFSATGSKGVTITLDGQLVDDSVDAVETSTRQAMSQASQVHMYLRDVSHIDGSGRSLLVRLAAEGVQLSAAGVYSSYIVSEISRDRPKVPAAARLSLRTRETKD